MVTAKDIHEHIQKERPGKNVVAKIGDDRILLLYDIKLLDKEFNPLVHGPEYVWDQIALINCNQDQLCRETHQITRKSIFVLYEVRFNGIMFGENFVLNIEDTYDASISFTNCNFMNKFKIRNKENNNYEEDQQKKIKLKSLEFIDCLMGGSEDHIDPYLRCGFLNVDEFVLKNLRVPAGAEVNIGDCHFKNFRLSNFRNLGKFKLYKINVQEGERHGNGTFRIDNTSIGDTDFQSLNLVSFDTRKIFDNILSGINYTNIQWENPEKDIEVGQFTPGDEITKRAKKRDTYRVLKNVAQRNDDMQQALAFYAKEMKWHRKLLKITAEISYICELFEPKKLSKLFDRMTLCFGACTNNYGQNWGLPIFWILVLSVVFYSGLLWSLPGEVWVSERWTEFPLFLNPTHKVGFICDGHWDALAYTIDILFRILEGMLIYQTIQAFRKYSRIF